MASKCASAYGIEWGYDSWKELDCDLIFYEETEEEEMDLLNDKDVDFIASTCRTRAYLRAKKFIYRKKLLRNAEIARLSMRKRKQEDKKNGEKKLQKKGLKFSTVKRAKKLLKMASKMEK